VESSLAWFQAWGDSWGNSWGPLHEVFDPPWDTDQGIAPNWVRFTPLTDTTVKAGSHSSKAGSSIVSVETRSVTEVTLRSSSAACRVAVLGVQTALTVSTGTHRATARVAQVYVSSFATVNPTTVSGRSGFSKLQATGDASAVLRSVFSGTGVPPKLVCDVVKNPTDDELVMMVMRTIRIDTAQANR
jgi:hypothetical protein